jgi:hypothetical protein
MMTYFVLKRDCAGTVGFSSTAVMMLAYGTPTNAKDEYLRISECMVIDSMYKFYRVMVAVLG